MTLKYYLWKLTWRSFDSHDKLSLAWTKHTIPERRRTPNDYEQVLHTFSHRQSWWRWFSQCACTPL